MCLTCPAPPPAFLEPLTLRTCTLTHYWHPTQPALFSEKPFAYSHPTQRNISVQRSTFTSRIFSRCHKSVLFCIFGFAIKCNYNARRVGFGKIRNVNITQWEIHKVRTLTSWLLKFYQMWNQFQYWFVQFA